MNRLAIIATAAGAAAVAVIAFFLLSGPGDDRSATDDVAATEQTATADSGSDATSGATDSSGTGDSATETANLDQPEPAATEPAMPEAVRPSFDIVRVTPEGGLVAAGRGEPGSAVTLRVNQLPFETVEADEHGEWVMIPELPLEPGTHELGLIARLPDDTLLESSDVVVVVVPKPEQVAEGGDEGQAMAVILPDTEGTPAQVLQGLLPQPGEGIESGSLSIDSVDYNEAGDVTVGGRAPVGADLRIYLDNELVATAESDATGRWAGRPSDSVVPGLHWLRVDQVDDEGQVQARVETPFQRDELAPDMSRDESVVVQPGNSLWRIARRVYGEGLRYTVIYEANKEQIRDPDLIYPGQVFVMPPEAGSAN